jgi:hypothetical protein
MTAAANRFAHLAMQALDRGRRVDDLAHCGRKGEERNDLFPIAPPVVQAG